MSYLLLLTSVFLDTCKNIYYNYFGKNLMQSKRDTLLFNVFCCIGAVIYFICRGASFGISSYSMIMAIIFGAVTVAAQYFGLLSMGLGPMSYSVLFTYLSMLIPVTFGIVYGGNIPTAMQIAGIALMLVTFVLSCEMKGNTKVSIKWILAAFGSFLGWGLVGICQQLHQSSAYAEELTGFLLWTFIFSAIFFGILFLFSSKEKSETSEKSNNTGLSSLFLMLVTGVSIGAINEINLYLCNPDVMNPIIFFPIVSGGVILLSGLAAITIFREKLSVKQWIGLVTGFASIMLLGI